MSAVLLVRQYFTRRFSILPGLKFIQSYPRIHCICKYCSSNPDLSPNDTAATKDHVGKKSNPAEVYKAIRKKRRQQIGDYQEVSKLKSKQKKKSEPMPWTEREIKILAEVQTKWLNILRQKNSNKTRTMQSGINTWEKSNDHISEKISNDAVVFDDHVKDFQAEVVTKLRTESNIQWANFIPGTNRTAQQEIYTEIYDQGNTETDAVYRPRKTFEIDSHLSGTSWLEKLRASKGKLRPLRTNHDMQGTVNPDMFQLFNGQPKLSLEYLVPTDTLLSKAGKLFDYSNSDSSQDKNDSFRSSVSKLDISNRQNAGELDDLVSNDLKGSEKFSKTSTAHLQQGVSKPDRSIRVREDEQNYLCKILQSKSAATNLPALTNFYHAGNERKVQFKNDEEKFQEWLEKVETKHSIALGQEFMTSYIEVSTFTGMFSKALRDFKEVRDTEHYGKGYPINLAIYNTLLRGVANTNVNIKVMQYLLQYMEEDKIKPDLETYAYCLVIISNRKENIFDLGPGLLDSIKENGFDVQDIFHHCELTVKEANGIRNVFRILVPEMKIHPRHSVQQYTEPLLASLNTPTSQTLPTKVSSSPINAEDILKKAKEQLHRELIGTVSIPSLLEEDKTADEQMEQIISKWRETTTSSFRKLVEKYKHQIWSVKEPNLFPYLCLFPESEYVDIILQEATHLATSKHYSRTTSRIMYDLSRKVFEKYKIYYNMKAKSTVMLSMCYKEYVNRILTADRCDLNYRQIWQEISSDVCPYTPTNINPKSWASTIHKKIGRLLLNIILKDLKIEVSTAAGIYDETCFRVVRRVQDHKRTWEVQPHRKLDIFNLKEMIKDVKEVPMICPPLPFVSTSFGGMFTNTAPLLITNSALHEEWLNKVNPKGVIDTISILASSAWVINKPVLDIVLYLFRQGGAPELGVPTNPKSLIPPRDGSRQEMEAFKKLYAETESLWYSEMYKYAVANKMRDEIFWYSYEMDFRSRNYPLSLVNHQGRDVVRGFMKFANSKPLGEEGLKWLKIHIVNLTGLKKRDPLEDRLKYAEEIMDEIKDSAENPLHGRKWWTKSDDPFQTLAACMELMAALRSPNPAEFYSNLPLHQDGSCNGLQHYAALGLDVEGAKQVNLYPFDQPSDVYSSVVDEIFKAIDEDIESSEHDNIEVIHAAKKYLNRKTVKQSVMTQVYGVTEYGVRKQIRGQLKDTTCPDNLQRPVAAYLTEKTFKSIKSIFSAGKDIQAWLTDCADIIGRGGETVRWVTPLNFPVIQSYHKIEDSKFIHSGIEHLPVDKLKQRNGFPPNFVHSLDATHMMLTALHCQREGIQFVGVHDSFWTHACDLDRMNKITREQFVALHQQPILESLSQYFLQEYKDCVPEEQSKLKNKKFTEEKDVLFQSVPETGDFDLNLVKDSTYFFS